MIYLKTGLFVNNVMFIFVSVYYQLGVLKRIQNHYEL